MERPRPVHCRCQSSVLPASIGLPSPPQRANRSDYAEALYAAERWRDSWNVRQEVCRATFDGKRAVDGSQVADVNCLGWAAVLAARLEQRDTADAIDHRLAGLPYRFRAQEGNALGWRAQAAAVLGDRPGAIVLLRQAIDEAGFVYGGYWHRHPDLRLLRDYKPYRDLMRPKG